MRLIILLTALAIVSCATLWGCASMAGDGAAASVSQITGDWRLVDIGGEPVGQVLPVADRAPTMIITEDGRIAGFGGVNRYSAKIDLDALSAGRFTTSPIISTKMAGPGEAMAIEARFFDLLSQADRVSATGGYLRLFAADATLLRFRRE